MEFSVHALIVVLASGLLIGWLAEFSYRSLEKEKIVWPLFVNVYMYGCTAVASYLLYISDSRPILVILTLFLLTTGIEFATGYLFLKLKKVRLWDYSGCAYNYKGIVCAQFSLYWLGAALVYYYIVLPSIPGV